MQSYLRGITSAVGVVAEAREGAIWERSAESQLRDYRERLAKPFQHDKYLSELTELRDQLKAQLSATEHESGEERGPSASELAEKIKALKGANTIEATPQRLQRK